MGFKCRIEADSIAPTGERLTTFVVRFPRVILAEFNTHRVLSRNASSSRAIPVSRRITEVLTDPFLPALTVKGAGMVSNDTVDDATQREWENDVRELRDTACRFAQKWADRGHKQHVNRYLEPWAWVDVVASGTDWNGFFALRCHKDAQPEFQTIAEMMRDALRTHYPDPVEIGGWHLPFTSAHDRATEPIERLHALSVGRLRRVSYANHDGTFTPDKDVAGYQALIDAAPAHASPFEHVATPAMNADTVRGNFRGWHQLRHRILREPGT